MFILFILAVMVLGAVVMRLRNQVNQLTIDLKEHKVRLDALEALKPIILPQAEPVLREIPVQQLPASAPSGPWGAAAREPVAQSSSSAGDGAQNQPISDEPVHEMEAKAAMETEVRPKRDIETSLGSRWAVWVGGVALAFGGLFLVRYSIESGFFGPAARLSFAAIFGLLLLAAGEFVRRTGFKIPIEGLASAYVPAILTAAGGFTLFAATYVAHGFYGFIGPGLAFVLLGLISVGVMGLSLIHGLPLAAAGLLGALVAPALVASQAPNVWALFVYLAFVLVTALAVCRIRDAYRLAAFAFAGVGVWMLLYLWNGPIEVPVVLFISAVMVCSLALLWNRTTEYGLHTISGGRWPQNVVALFVAVTALALSRADGPFDIYAATAIITMLLAAAIWKDALVPLLVGAGLAGSMILTPPEVLFYAYFVDASLPFDWIVSSNNFVGAFLGLIFLIAGLWKARQLIAIRPERAAVWVGWAGLVPLVIIFGLWWRFGDPWIDLYATLPALTLAMVLGYAGERLARLETPRLTGGAAVSVALIGAAAAAVFALRTGLGPTLATMAIAAAAVIPALATRLRSYPVLGWLSVGTFLLTVLRIGLDPTIVGWRELATAAPVFNILLPAYGIPAVAFAFSAWQLARTTDGRPRSIMEVAAVLFAMLTIAMLVRHAMTGGDVVFGQVTLAEQSIYTLLSLGMGGALIAIGQRSPSPVMTYGSLVLGCVGAAAIIVLHFVSLNPLFTDEPTGRIAVFNLLFLGYLMPAAAAGGLALYARRKRPAWYSIMLGLLASALAFVYVTLSLRRLFQGEHIAYWYGMSQLENYAYSALWLAFGVVLLVLGLRLRSYALRLASALLILLTVVKVFLFDMANLEGILRALSFIGLGVILIGIGLAYQRLLSGGKPKPAVTPPAPALDARPPLP